LAGEVGVEEFTFSRLCVNGHYADRVVWETNPDKPTPIHDFSLTPKAHGSYSTRRCPTIRTTFANSLSVGSFSSR